MPASAQSKKLALVYAQGSPETAKYYLEAWQSWLRKTTGNCHLQVKSFHQRAHERLTFIPTA